MKILFAGASGYGNVGDDCYVRLIKRFMKDHELLFFNSDLPGGKHPEFPDRVDMVVIGGGGLLYGHDEHFKKMNWYCRHAMKRKIPYGFLSIGYQFKPRTIGTWQKAVVKKWQPYVQKAAFITVRSESDREYTMDTLEREDVQYYPDLCYLIGKGVKLPVPSPPPRLIIVPGAGVAQSSKRATAKVQDLYTNNLITSYIRAGWDLGVVRFGAMGDDGYKIKRLRKLYGKQVVNIDTKGDPQQCFKHIAESQMVITGRYHGMVFARAAGVQYLTMPMTPYKVYVEDKTERNPKVLEAQAWKHIETLQLHIKRLERGDGD